MQSLEHSKHLQFEQSFTRVLNPEKLHLFLFFQALLFTLQSLFYIVFCLYLKIRKFIKKHNILLKI